ncbi:MAG: hypothetical protein IKV74_03955 [Clostridia bacterium]|nr:hypothetical protein [Clostridia bacterium]
MENRWMKKILSLIALCLVAATLFTACTGGETVDPTTDPTEIVSGTDEPGSEPMDGTTTAPTQKPSSGATTKPTSGATTKPTAGATTKPQVNIDLRFSNTGKFKILILSDLRLSKSVDKTVISNMEKMLDKVDPDLVILGGDIHNGTIANEADLRKVLDAVNAPLEARKIPWCHAFGVDAEGTATKKTGYKKTAQMAVYQSYPYCVSKSSSSDVYGVSNYVLPIKQSTGNKVGFNVWCFDANGYLNDFEAGLENKVLLSGTLSGATNLDCIHFTQRLWYWNTSLEMQEANGGKSVPGMMYMQVPPYQFRYIFRNKDRTGMTGIAKEKQSSPERDSGIVWTAYERADIKGIFCGYNEANDYAGTYLDMLFAQCSTIGKSDYETTRGARVVELTNNGSKMTSSMVYLTDLK